MFKRYFVPNLIGTCKQQHFITSHSSLYLTSHCRVLKMYTPNNR